jgi:hypothetical protein
MAQDFTIVLTRLLIVDRLGWVDALSWLMVAQVVISQLFVWSAIVTGRLALDFGEELGWAIRVAANAAASAGLWETRGEPARRCGRPSAGPTGDPDALRGPTPPSQRPPKGATRRLTIVR